MPENERSHPQMCAIVFNESHDDPKRMRAAAELLMEASFRHVTEDHHPCTADSHDTIAGLLPDMNVFDPNLAVQ